VKGASRLNPASESSPRNRNPPGNRLGDYDYDYQLAREVFDVRRSDKMGLDGL